MGDLRALGFPEPERGLIGELSIVATDVGYRLTHREDVERADLVSSAGSAAAGELALYDDAGKYRPLKTAPTLRHGWEIRVAGEAEVADAVDAFYPGRLSALTAWNAQRLTTTALRETLGRQTGMYRAAARITDEQVEALVGQACHSDGGCLRTILWKRDAAGACPSASLPPEKFDPMADQFRGEARVAPLLCQEICNILVAEAREVVKKAEKAVQTG